MNNNQGSLCETRQSPNFVIPAQAGIQQIFQRVFWIPACAGMTG